MTITPGKEFEIHYGKAEFNTEDEAYCFLRDNDFFGGEYKVRHFRKKDIYVVYYEDWQEVTEGDV